jgi:hypothetical protein
MLQRLVLITLAATSLAVAGCGLFPFLLDTVTSARIRVIHASPDAPAVDVCANGSVAFSNAGFPSATSYASLDSGTYAVRVVPANAGCSSPGVIDANIPLIGGTDVTVMAVGLLDNIEAIVLTDDNTAPQSGNAKVRFVHASPDAPTVDITLTDGTTLFDDISFKESGGYIEVAAGTYTLEVRDETGTTVVLTLEDITVSADTVYTVTAVGLLSGSPALDVLITMDS